VCSRYSALPARSSAVTSKRRQRTYPEPHPPHSDAEPASKHLRGNLDAGVHKVPMSEGVVMQGVLIGSSLNLRSSSSLSALVLLTDAAPVGVSSSSSSLRAGFYFVNVHMVLPLNEGKINIHHGLG